MQTSPETQGRVRQAAEELGYTGNAVARALASGRTGLVGVLSGSLEDLGEQRFIEALGRALGGAASTCSSPTPRRAASASSSSPAGSATAGWTA